MKKHIINILTLILFFGSISLAQGPRGKDVGFGIILGDPTGATLKIWTNNENAFKINLGTSYFGSPRIGGDYIWHFNAFESRVIKLYAGPGVAVGFGEGKGPWFNDEKGKFWTRDDDENAGIAVRVIFGLNFIPRDTPFEFFLELGPLIGLAPDIGSAFDAGLGVRFYP